MYATAVFRDSADDDAASRLVCPLCTYDRQALRAVHRRGAQAAAQTLVLEFEGGCGCRWQLCLEPLEKRTQACVHILRPCLRPYALQPLADAAEAERLLEEHEL